MIYHQFVTIWTL